MGRVLRAIFVEDSLDDAETLELELRQAGFDVVGVRVETAADFHAALERRDADIVFSDHSLPAFDAPGALAVLKASGQDIPFVVVSGTIGEETAVAIMRSGASDFVLKNNRIRLAAVVDRELREAQNRRARNHAEQKSQQMAAIVQSSFDPIISETLDGIITSWNLAAERLYGWKAEEMVGQPIQRLVPQDHIAQLSQALQRVRNGERVETFETVRLNKSGERIDVAVTLSPVSDASGRLTGISKIVRDIRERKRAERELRESEAKLAEAVRLARMGYWSRDLASDEVEWSEMLYEIFGVTRDEYQVTYGSFLARVHPEDRDNVSSIIGQAVASHGSFDHTYRILIRDEVRVIHEVGRVLELEQGRPARVAGTAQDVTDQMRAAETLRLRDRAIGAATQGIVICDPHLPDCPITYASPGFERLTGYSEAETLGRNCRFLQGAGTDLNVVAQLREAVRDGRACTVELLNYKKNGDSFWNELSIAPVCDGQGNLTHFVGVQTDVTQRRLLESQYYQAQKMDAVGRLAAGVAHDFNNLLTIISGYTELAIESLKPDDAMREFLFEIQRAGQRSAALTRQLLLFSRQQVIAPQLLDLNHVVEDAEKMLRRVIGEDIRLEARLGTLEGCIRADSGQMDQVLMNLAVNARDAMPRGGRLTIETREVDFDEEYSRWNPGLRPGHYLELSVSDTGCGMTDEVRARLFEPFFTTKEVGKGTGLGLAVVHGVVKQAEGHIQVDSQLDVGTTFHLYFPSYPAPRETASSSSATLMPMGNETVLLVEDESSLRALSRQILVGCGYNVIEAVDGHDALQIAGSHRDTIHLVVTDVVMPRLGGRQLVERLLRLHPETRVLYVSGYTNDAIVRHGIQQDEVHFLQKPFAPPMLAAKIRTVLDGS